MGSRRVISEEPSQQINDMFVAWAKFLRSKRLTYKAVGRLMAISTSQAWRICHKVDSDGVSRMLGVLARMDRE